MAYQEITYETRGPVALVTFNRPDKLNAISVTMREETHAAFREAHGDDSVRAVVVTGAGRGFCSGVDLSGVRPADMELRTQNEKLDEIGWVGRWAKLFHDFDKPVIAALNGVAAGAGMSAALAADVRVGCSNTRFKTVFAERSLSPDSGMSFFLPRIVGYARAADLIFTSRAVDAEEAYRLGLIDRLAPADKLIEEAVAFGEQMAQWPPLAIRSAKRVLQQNIEADLDTALRNEIAGLSFARRAVNDAKESIAAFREKRKPTYTGT